jgi:hypothetical protein
VLVDDAKLEAARPVEERVEEHEKHQNEQLFDGTVVAVHQVFSFRKTNSNSSM